MFNANAIHEKPDHCLVFVYKQRFKKQSVYTYILSQNTDY